MHNEHGTTCHHVHGDGCLLVAQGLLFVTAGQQLCWQLPTGMLAELVPPAQACLSVWSAWLHVMIEA